MKIIQTHRSPPEEAPATAPFVSEAHRVGAGQIRPASSSSAWGSRHSRRRLSPFRYAVFAFCVFAGFTPMLAVQAPRPIPALKLE